MSMVVTGNTEECASAFPKIAFGDFCPLVARLVQVKKFQSKKSTSQVEDLTRKVLKSTFECG